MKKVTAGLTFAAVVGLSALSATPALAVTGAYPNCSVAEAEGVFNIPVGAPGYGPHLDSDGDGIGCEKAGVAYTPAPQAPVAAPVTPAAPKAQVAPKQIVRVPVGGADTGVATKSTDNSAALALGGGLVLAAAAAGTFVVRRRNA